MWEAVHEPGGTQQCESIFKNFQTMQFWMKLFLCGCVSLSEESSPIRKGFQSGESKIDVDNANISLIQQTVNFIKQMLEQKEPNDCVKLPLSYEEGVLPAGDLRKRKYTHCLPDIFLDPEFIWNSSYCVSGDIVPVCTRVMLFFRLELVDFLAVRTSGENR